MELPDIKKKELVQEKHDLTAVNFKMKYALKNKFNSNLHNPVLFGKEIDFIIMGNDSGILNLWNSTEELINNSGSLIYGHSDRIVDIKIS